MKVRTLRLLGLLLLSLALIGCDDGPPLADPALIGIWRTDTPSHADRLLRIEPRFVAFGQDGGMESVFVIQSIAERREDGRRRFTIECEDGKGDGTTLHIVLEERATPILRFENQVDVPWTKRKLAPEPLVG